MPDMRTPWTAAGGPRMRVVSDNDYSGDPDGLVQLAHHALSTSVDLRCG
jgi:purine nucleosidase